jgi:hypothetical protein
MNIVSKKESRFVKNIFTVTLTIVSIIAVSVIGFAIGYTIY